MFLSLLYTLLTIDIISLIVLVMAIKGAKMGDNPHEHYQDFAAGFLMGFFVLITLIIITLIWS